MAVYDRQTGKLIPEFYTWADYTQWDPGGDLTWDLLDGSYTSSLGVPDLTFTTEIIDFGRTAWVNPLCTAITSGTHTIQVFAAESIDSSSLLPGDAVIDTDVDTNLNAVYGRYFQFKVNVFDGVDSYIRGVQTNLSATTQSESFNDDSNTHPGTIAMRYAPITKSYSKLLSITGTGEVTADIIPLVVRGSLDDVTQPRYKVYNILGSGGDSSTIVGSVVDYTGQKSLTNVGPVTVTTIASEYQWPPFGLETLTNQYIEFEGSGVGGAQPGTADFTLEGWVKTVTAGDYFLRIQDSATDYRLRLVADGANWEIGYSTDGGSNWTQRNTSTSGTGFLHWALIKNSNTVRIHFDGSSGGGGYNADNDWDMDNMTIRIGCVGTGEQYWDDIRYSQNDQYEGGITSPPAAVFIQDADTLLLVNGGQRQVISLPQDLVETDATVSITVIGLPAMTVDSAGNIVET